MANGWYDAWLRTGKLPDGRQAFSVMNRGETTYVCCDPVIIERYNKKLAVPDPGESAEDGFVTPWEEFTPPHI